MNCDRIAPFYQSLEYVSFGRQLERRRVAYLQEAAESRSALLCGGGDGRFLARLLHFNPRVQVDFVDLSPKMVKVAENRISAMGQDVRRRVHFHCADVRSFRRSRDGYDLIVTHFFLDCFSEAEIDAVVSCLAASANPEARWLLSEFQEAAGPIGRLYTRAVIRSLYAAFHVATGLQVFRLPDYTRPLAAHGFSCQTEERALGGLLCSSLWCRGPRQLGIH